MRLRFVQITMLWLVCVVLGSAANARPAPESFADLVDTLMPSVVNVSTTQTSDGSDNQAEFFTYQFPEGTPFKDLPDLFEKFYGERMPGNNNDEDSDSKDEPKKNGREHKEVSLGSGFILEEDGYIVTNNHVIDKADEITVIFSDDTKAKAKIIGRDAKTDIALLKVEVNRKLPAIKWGDSDKGRVGDWVIAIGNPFGLGGSVSAGIISARARDINAGPFDDFIQTDAAINRGNSGGPLFNTRGELIGINTAIFSPTGGNVGIGFSLPASLAYPVIKQLRETGKVSRGWLGVKIQTVTEEFSESLGLKDTSGALVIEVNKGSPAEKAGIQPSDVILQFDGKDIPIMRKLPRIVADTPINKTVDVIVWRNGKKETLQVHIAQLADEEAKEEKTVHTSEKQEKRKDNYGVTTKKLGMTLAEVTENNRKQFRLKEEQQGVLVVKLDDKSSAAEKGIQRGDVIEGVNQSSIANIKEFEEAIDRAKQADRKSVMLLVNRRGMTQFIVVNL
jgi:serine protease Do